MCVLFVFWNTFCVTCEYFFVPFPDNIMRTLQTLSVNEWGHNAGCLGKFVSSVIHLWSTQSLSRCVISVFSADVLSASVSVVTTQCESFQTFTLKLYTLNAFFIAE